MTYEYLGAGVRENEPQRTLYRCPIHSHVALVDGSVQHGRAPSPGATMQIQPQRVDRSHAESAPSEVDIINTILNRLRQIDGAKEQWALENRQPVGTQPTEQDIINYLPGGWVPIAGERYELKPVGESPVAVLTQPIGNRITGELIGLGSPAVAADVRPIRIRVKADGKVELDGTSIELSELTDRLREFSVDPFRRAPGGHPPTILLLAEEDPSEDVVLAVIHAVLTLRFGQVHAQTTVYPAIQNELERLGKQIDDLREEYDRLARRQTDGDRERVILSQERKEAEAQLRTANRRLDASRTRPELFPDIINKDERYQRLKQEYEAAVLSRDEEAAKRAQEQLKVWVEQIYRPELEAQRDFAIETFNHLHLRLEELDHDLRSWKAAQDRLMEQQRELQARHSQLALLIPPATGS